MLSREERIFSELLLARGRVARDFIEGYAKSKSGADAPSLAEVLIDSGEIERDEAEEALEEARAIDAALAPHLKSGARLGEFLLVREIGRGGMGIVYEAVQESLGRRVAVKVLPAGAALDERLAIRFLREARAAAKLQHPGIVPVFASGQAEGVLFFAMELVEGRSLAEVVSDGSLSAEQAARLIAEVARALEHAHAAGLVHRDVKPENILLATDGRARLTDFGLVHENVATSFTLPRHVLGTPAYTAPEQAIGGAVDRRCDIYALGAVLYTLLSGRAPYGGDVPSIVLSRVVAAPPPSLLALRGDIPSRLVAICERAMARRPEDRYATAAELARELEAFGRGEGLTTAASPVRADGIGRFFVGALATLAAGALIAALVMRGGSEEPVPVASRRDPTFVLVNDTAGSKGSPALSPDGRFLAYGSWSDEVWSLWLVDLETRDIVKLAEPGCGPAFSPDGRSLAFVVPKVGVEVLDLRERTVRHFGGFAGRSALTWSADGREIVAACPTLGGCGLQHIAALDLTTGRWRVARGMESRGPAYAPHGLRVAFVASAGGPVDVWTTPTGGGDAVRLTSDAAVDWSPFWSPDGRRIYFGSDRSGTPALWRVGLDEASGRSSESPEPAFPVAFPAIFEATLSADGKRMAIVSDGDEGRLFRFPFDPLSGTLVSPPVALPRHPSAATSAQPSPDGRFLVYTALSTEEDLAIVAADGSGEPRFLTNDAFVDRAPRWSPDGERIAFHSDRSGAMAIWTVRPDGSDLRQVTQDTHGSAAFPVWSPDGSRLAFSVEGAGPHAIVMPLGGGEASVEALPTEGTGGSFEPWSWSADGTTLAGSASGVVLYSLRDRSYRRITDFGGKPVWVADGHRLLFASGRSLFTVSRDGGASREIYSAAPSGLLPSFGVSADGRSIYASLTASRNEIWIADLSD